MTEELILVNESVDEVGAVVCHAHSMAENRAKVKGLWTVCNVALQFVEDLRFANQHAVDLGCFVSLAFA